MVRVMTLHMIQVFLCGAYKYPRELTWIVGVLLFLCTLGMAFTGQMLRWDQDAYWGLGIGASIAGARARRRIGASCTLLLGGPIIAGRHLVALLRAARLRDPGHPDRADRAAPLAGAEARHQRVADAGPAGRSRRLPRRVRGGGPAGRRAVRPASPRRRTWSSPAWSSSPCWRARRSSALRAQRHAGPDDHRDRPAARLLLPCRCSALLALLPPWTETRAPARRPAARRSCCCWRCRSSPAPARRAGGAGRSRC